MEEHDPAGASLRTVEINRKGFIQRGAVAAGGLIVLGRPPGAGNAQAAAADAIEDAPAAPTSPEMTTRMAILAGLLPADSLGPGAVEANAHVYIDRELTGYLEGRP